MPEPVERRVGVVQVAEQMIEGAVLQGEDHHVVDVGHDYACWALEVGPVAAAASFSAESAASSPFLIWGGETPRRNRR